MAVDIRDAFDRLKTSISTGDAQDFQSTTLRDVRSAAEAIEKQQAQRQSLQNMRRIEPFLKFMEQYSRVIEAGCQGFSPMAWVWGPLKLMLQLASQYGNILEKLLEAYKRISEELPRVDRLRRTFGNDEGFQKTLGLIYVDIVGFHGRAYKFFRRRAWHMIFECTWRNFEHRFGAILDDLRRHSDLLDREAASIHFAEAKEATVATQRKIDDTEAQRKRAELREVQQWLAVGGDQEARLDKLAKRCQPESCEWMFRNDSITSWLHQTRNKPIVWIKGNPGSGKSVACSQLVEYLREQQDIQPAFYFCNYAPNDPDTCILVIRNIASQLLQCHSDIVTYIFHTYVGTAQTISMKRMKALLRDIFSAFKACRIVLDGIDECAVEHQKEIISTFLAFQANATDSCKVLFSSRNDESHIARFLSRKAVISLRGQTDSAIALYTREKVDELSHIFGDLDDKLVTDINHQICSKAKGMFLWVRLVVDDLENQTTIDELTKSLEQLPSGLNEAYDRILDRIRLQLSNAERSQALEVLKWICCAIRPLQVHEIEDGIAFRHGSATPDMNNRICRSIFELCGPLIEELPDGSVDTVHFSAKEYLLHQHSGPLVDHAVAHRSLAYACVSYLNTRTALIPKEGSIQSPDAIERCIVKGYNGLDDYANHFWVDHVLIYTKGAPTNADCTELTLVLKDFTTSWRRDRPPSPIESSTAQPVELLSSFSSSPEIRDLIGQALVFRKRSRLNEETSMSTQPQVQWNIDNEPTFLSYVHARISETIQYLLALPLETLPPHLNRSDFLRFKRSYGSLGLRCRLSSCRRLSRTYKTGQERQTHEKTHQRLHRCTECDEKPGGFSSAYALRKHRETYHMKQEDFEVPKSLGSKPDTSNVMPQFGIDGPNRLEPMSFANLENADVLDNFDFDKFLRGDDNYPEPDTTVGFPLANPAEGVETGAEGQEQLQSQPKGQSLISSYWTVPEQTDFANLIHIYGTNWEAIADGVGTKNKTQVKNYYHRQIERGESKHIEQIAKDADQRALSDYQRQLMLLEQQKNEQPDFANDITSETMPRFVLDPRSSEDYQIQLMREQRRRRADDFVRSWQGSNQ